VGVRWLTVGASLEIGFGNVASAVQKISYLLGKNPHIMASQKPDRKKFASAKPRPCHSHTRCTPSLAVALHTRPTVFAVSNCVHRLDGVEAHPNHGLCGSLNTVDIQSESG